MNTTVRPITILTLASGLLVSAACEVTKSENFLSPSIAGPLPGVTITSPRPMEPPQGAEVLTTSLPLRLVFENASSNSPRPFWQTVEIAADHGFTNTLYRSEQLPPNGSGRTTHTVPGQLAHGATYYWRVTAADGANASPPSNPAFFMVVEPVVIDAPVPLSPVNGATTSSASPDFTVANGPVSGPAGTVVYRFQVATDTGFGGVVASGTTTRSSSGTTTHNVGTLPSGQLFFWRAWGTNGKESSPYSSVQSFRTPVPAPTPTPGPYTPPPPPSGNNRTPDPPPGQRLPLPNMFSVVEQVAREHPGALANSCQNGGGTWEFMDRVVDRLRTYDTRWGYNWKRAVVGDPSHDVINYHWGPGPDEGSRDVYTIDIIAGHCGSNPTPAWFDLTDPNGSCAMWTGRGRF